MPKGSSTNSDDQNSCGQSSERIEAHLANIKAALMSLKATGEDGFEGLVGIALGAVMGLRFRLPKSGFQRGMGGEGDREAKMKLCLTLESRDVTT
ncbi:MAG: hypothetical protein ACI9NQ_000533 [Paracoccaceae bacterium]|jgi:hypothetical protein